MTILDLVVLALAANAVATAWFYGSIFENIQTYFEKRGGLLGELMTCPLCLPYHIAFWVVVLLWLPGFFLWEPWTTVSRIPLYAFAVTTLVHYMQGVLPLEEDEEDDDEEDDDGQAGEPDDEDGVGESSGGEAEEEVSGVRRVRSRTRVSRR